MPVASHSILCAAPPPIVYRIITDSERWPALFEPCLEVRALNRSDEGEEIEVAAMVNGTPTRWRSQRRFLPEILGVDSIALVPMPLVRSMRTQWRIVPANAAQCALVLDHEFEVLDDVAGLVEGVATRDAAAAYIARAIAANSTRELADIRDAAEAEACIAPEAADTLRRTRAIVCEASAAQVYAAIAETANWPLLFDACTSATVIGGEAGEQRVRIEALQGGKTISWITRRTLRPEIHRIDFVLETPMPFLAAMHGQWRVTPLAPERTLLSVARCFALREGPDLPPPAEALRFLDDNAEAEMLAIRALVEQGDAAFTLVRSRQTIPFAPDRVYRALAGLRRWPEMLPHCIGLEILHDDGVGQEFVMRVAGGERFRSVRTCDRQALAISYFQPQPPLLLAAHQGSWRVRAALGGCEVIAEHRLRIDSARCAERFGEDDLVRNKARVREMVAANSLATIRACAAWLERGGGRRWIGPSKLPGSRPPCSPRSAISCRGCCSCRRATARGSAGATSRSRCAISPRTISTWPMPGSGSCGWSAGRRSARRMAVPPMPRRAPRRRGCATAPRRPASIGPSSCSSPIPP